MIIYGVYFMNQPEDTLMNLFQSAEDANDFVDARKHPSLYYVQEMQVY